MKKRTIITIISVIILGLIVGGVYFYYTKQDKNTALTIVEKQWIENNKNKLIDMQIINNIPIFNSNGQGVIFDFLNDLNKKTGLGFNKLSYENTSKPTSKYAIEITDSLTKDHISITKDNYVIVSSNNAIYTTIADLPKMVIGVLDSEIDRTNKYLKGADVTYKSYNSVDKMFTALTKKVTDLTVKEIDAVIIPKTIYLNKILTTPNLYINYNVTEMNKYIAIKLGDVNRLNDILKKYYQKWSSENFNESYNIHLMEEYFKTLNVSEKQKVEFRSKRYNYGFVSNASYDLLFKNKLYGTNNNLIDKFADIANIEINFTNYKSNDEMVKAFNTNKIDFMFDNLSNDKYEMDTFNTVSPYNERIAVISNYKNDMVINSISSLENKEVLVVKNTKLEKYLIENGVKVKSFNNLESMIKDKKTNSIMLIDYDSYIYYSKNKLYNYKIDFVTNIDKEYSFISRSINDNKLFNQFFNFYLSFYPINSTINSGLYDIVQIAKTPISIIEVITYIGLALIVLIIVLIIVKLFKKKNKPEVVLTKEDKLKYIDLLTSLKNRNYLNSKIEEWDESEVYPQSIVIIDLNNVAYINDNYGHQEGDKVIKDAANILILNQIENSEMMRTNGNEFLLYLVGYEEKEIVTYIRKLFKEFKELEHGFGAALGYSIINDAIKTIDDAINEATLDMKNNKEELNN